MIPRGWELFGGAVPPDVADAILRLVADPAPLAAALRACGETLLQGDLKLGNLGTRPGRSVMLDWQAWGPGPPAVELAWFVAINATRCEGTREDIVASFERAQREALGGVFDAAAWRRSLGLALVGGLVSLGWNKALDALEAPSAADRARERSDLDWWVDRAREGLALI